eukprot:2974929-Rhodomonas_salina.1
MSRSKAASMSASAAWSVSMASHSCCSSAARRKREPGVAHSSSSIPKRRRESSCTDARSSSSSSTRSSLSSAKRSSSSSHGDADADRGRGGRGVRRGGRLRGRRAPLLRRRRGAQALERGRGGGGRGGAGGGGAGAAGAELDEALEGGVPAVLDGVVGAAREQPRDLRPLVLELGVRVHEDLVLLCRPRLLLDARVQL